MSFDEIYKNNYAAVYILARRMVNDEDVSKDIAQDVFLRLYDVLGSGEKILNVGGWLGRVTYNHSLNHLRDSSRVVNHIAIDKADTDGATDVKLIESEDAEWVRKAVGRLEAREQSLIRLWCWESLPG